MPQDILVERVVGRRTDPETGEIYHMKFKPPPTEIVDRLVQRSDDTEEKVVGGRVLGVWLWRGVGKYIVYCKAVKQ